MWQVLFSSFLQAVNSNEVVDICSILATYFCIIHNIITQYGSTVNMGMALVWPAL